MPFVLQTPLGKNGRVVLIPAAVVAGLQNCPVLVHKVHTPQASPTNGILWSHHNPR